MASFQAIPKAKDLLDYTMERTTAKDADGGAKPRFPKSQTFGYCKALRDAALAILERIQAANDYYFETQFDERLIALDTVMQKCELMLHLIDLSLRRKYITGDQAHYWTEMVLAVKRPVFTWRKNDGNRAAVLRNERQASDTMRMAEVIRTYLTDTGRVVRTLRQTSVKKMRAKVRYWSKAYPQEEVSRDEILASWQAWDAHAAHGDTWRLRQEIRQSVKEILKEDI